ncbi:MAG: hypothetical protein AB2A00_06670 [Myxococcota bacterium]
MRRHLVGLPVLAVLLLAGGARADVHELEMAAGLDAGAEGTGIYALPWGLPPRQKTPSYGVARAAWRWLGFWRPNVALSAEFNTDTLAAGLDAYNVGAPGLSVGLFSRAELGFAQVSLNQLHDGVNHPERGYTASYAMTGGRASYTVLNRLTVEGELGGRGWVFTPGPNTDRNWRIPAPFLALEPRARLKWHDLRPDEGGLGLHRGMAAMLEAGMDVRAFSRSFGGYKGGPVDPRNTVEAGEFPRRISARGLAGVPLARRLWVGLQGDAGYGHDEDDISRTVIGGMNPYTVNVPGAAWGEWRSERYVAGHAHAGILPLQNLYVGLSAHLCVLNDPHRVGALDELGVVRAFAAEVRVALARVVRWRLSVGGSGDVRRERGPGALGAFTWFELGLRQ